MCFPCEGMNCEAEGTGSGLASLNDVRGLWDAGAEPGFSDQAGPGVLKAGA